jgi:60 kDa SS-A/Ro ribonucleoprotein
MVNVAAFKNGVGYGPWVHIDGWSEAIVDYIRAYEAGP